LLRFINIVHHMSGGCLSLISDIHLTHFANKITARRGPIAGAAVPHGDFNNKGYRSEEVTDGKVFYEDATSGKCTNTS
jgi:hypothetical protein